MPAWARPAVRYARCLSASPGLRDQRLRHGRGLPRVVAPAGRRPRPRDGHHGLGQCPPCSAGPVRILCQQVRRHRIHGSDSHRMAAVRHPRSSGRPGFTDTPFDENVVVDTARVAVNHRRTMSPETVARATMRAMAPPAQITLSWQGKLFVLTSTVAPRLVDWGLTRWLLKHFPNAPCCEKTEETGTESEWSWSWGRGRCLGSPCCWNTRPAPR